MQHVCTPTFRRLIRCVEQDDNDKCSEILFDLNECILRAMRNQGRTAPSHLSHEQDEKTTAFSASSVHKPR